MSLYSGCFTFSLEDVLQVTVATGNITSATSNSIVISTDSHLCHENPVAQSVAKAAGTGFTRACQEFLRHNHSGLQVKACHACQDYLSHNHSGLQVKHVMHVRMFSDTAVMAGSKDILFLPGFSEA